MNETGSSLGLGLLALLSIVCCIGLPLVAATGISIVLAAWIGGTALAALVLIGAVVLLAPRVLRYRKNEPANFVLRTRR